MRFEDFELDQSILESIEAMGFTTPTPIQEQTIPDILSGKDMMGVAQTGTGKTAAFLLPIMQHIIHGNRGKNSVNTIIIVPTRELAVQIDQQLQGMSYFTNVSSKAVYGGGTGPEFEKEKRALSEGADVIIATPGRLKAHLTMGYVKLDSLEHFVLDEADRMLDMGFYDDIMLIEKRLPKKRQNIMFSATMPREIRKMAQQILHNPIQVDIGISKPAAGILQAAYMVYDNQKIELIKQLFVGKNLDRVLVFASTKSKVKDIARTLKQAGLQANEIHSDLEQREREGMLNKFKGKQVNILVATDILARGIDIESIDLVVNYDVPRDAEDYVHRVGRTARAEKTGVAITFINKDEARNFHKIEKLIETEVKKLPLPPQLGEGPEYNPHSGGSRGKSYGKGKGRGRGKGARR